MADPQPVLLVDVGGTLITRTRPGLTTRVVEAVRRTRPVTAEAEARIRRAVLTTRDADSCIAALGLPATVGALVTGVLKEDPGDAVVLPGAERLLKTAAALGWRVIVTSNAGPGTPDLPGELGRHVDSVVESRDCGLVKEDPLFWTRLLQAESIDARLALVVGDQEQADRSAPSAAGLQSRLVSAGLGPLTADLEAAGPAPAEATAVVAGDQEVWAGREIVVTPHLKDLVSRVTRARVKYAVGAGIGEGVVIRRRSAEPAMVGRQGGLPGVIWLLQARERSQYTIPAGLRDLLQHRGLSLDTLSPADRRHALSMIHEARANETLAERTADLVHFLEGRDERKTQS